MTLNRVNVFTGWACTDCLFWLANGDAPAGWTEPEVAEWRERIAHYTAGCEVTLGMFREEHGCRSNWTVTWRARHEVRGSLRGGTIEVLADSFADAMDEACWSRETPAGAWPVMARSHELATESDRGGECECEQLTFSSSPCDVCGSGLAGAREAVVFWIQGPAAVPEVETSNA